MGAEVGGKMRDDGDRTRGPNRKGVRGGGGGGGGDETARGHRRSRVRQVPSDRPVAIGPPPPLPTEKEREHSPPWPGRPASPAP